MRRSLSIILLFFYTTICGQNVTLSGVVLEASSNETLIGVTIAIPELFTGVITNEYGFYSISLPYGTYDVQVSYVGYQTIIRLSLIHI